MSRFWFAGGGLDQYTKILLHFDGNLTDYAKPSRVWTPRGSAGVSTGSFKFGTHSLFVQSGGGAGCIDTPDDADFTVGSGDFTVDCWFNRIGATSGAAQTLFSQNDSSNSTGSLSYRGSILIPLSNSPSFVAVSGTTTFTAQAGSVGGGWHHFAGVRTGGTLAMFIDGVLTASAAISGSVNNSANLFAIGRTGEYTATNLDWEGYIDEFRLSVGIARWTSNFTPPTAPYA